MHWQLAAILCGVVLIALAFLIWRGVRVNISARGTSALMREILDGAPIGLVVCEGNFWRPNPVAARLLLLPEAANRDQTLQEILAVFPPDQAKKLTSAVQFLQAGLGEFEEVSNTTKPGHVLAVAGKLVSGNPVLWLRDESESAWMATQIDQQEAVIKRYEGILDTVPIPIWWRNSTTFAVDGGNEAYYSQIREDNSGAVSLAQRASRTGLPQSESRSLVIGGNRRTLDITEIPVTDNAETLVGIGRDMTAVSDLQAQLSEHLEAHDQVLELLTTGIAIYGADKRLKFFNDGFIEIAHLPRHVLEQQPTMGEIYGLLRENRQLPETTDFQAYKRTREDYFTNLVDPHEYLVHRPDGRTLHCAVCRHPLGGLIFQYTDVTDRLALESSYNTLIAVQHSTLESLFEAVCVFGRDGRLKLFNSLYHEFFELDPEWLETGPHISQLVEFAQKLYKYNDDWETLRRRLIHSVSEPKPRGGRFALTTGRVIEYAYKPLPDGQCMIHYLDVTDTTKVEDALHDRNRALERADLLKRRFVADVSYELRTPLNAIKGFSELLQQNSPGTLTSQQLDYVDNILGASEIMANLVSEILDLAAVQAGFMEFVTTSIDIVEMLQLADQEIRDELGVDTQIDLSALPPSEMIVGDRRRIGQAISIILGDALRYVQSTRDEGNNSIGVEIVPSNAAEADAETRLRLTVPLGNIDKPPWSQRASGALGNELQISGATGADVGISLARSLIEAQGGRIESVEEGLYLDCIFPKQSVLPLVNRDSLSR